MGHASMQFCNPTNSKYSHGLQAQKLRSTSCEQWLDRIHRTLPWRSTSAGRY
uniref:Uncharacterized protein n=1 Tax=Arundo donax TaxID=35708 RepID=A0A0A9CCG9_ARUDO